MAASNKMVRLFRRLNRNFRDFTFGNEKKGDLEDYLKRTYGDKAKKEKLEE